MWSRESAEQRECGAESCGEESCARMRDAEESVRQRDEIAESEESAPPRGRVVSAASNESVQSSEALGRTFVQRCSMWVVFFVYASDEPTTHIVYI